MYSLTVIKCPRCQQYHPVSPDNKDFICQCDSPGVPASLAKEDVPELGTWSDYTGSGGEVGVIGARGLVTEVKDFVPKDSLYQYTDRGKRTSTHRVRSHEEFIDLK